MARLILCKKCNNQTHEAVEKTGEYYKSVIGAVNTPEPLHCDQCNIELFMGHTAYAGVLLDSPRHFNAERQDPYKWAGEFLTINR